MLTLVFVPNANKKYPISDYCSCQEAHIAFIVPDNQESLATRLKFLISLKIQPSPLIIS